MSTNKTTIWVDKETRNELYYAKQPEESYDDYLRRVFELESDEDTDD